MFLRFIFFVMLSVTILRTEIRKCEYNRMNIRLVELCFSHCSSRCHECASSKYEIQTDMHWEYISVSKVDKRLSWRINGVTFSNWFLVVVFYTKRDLRAMYLFYCCYKACYNYRWKFSVHSIRILQRQNSQTLWYLVNKPSEAGRSDCSFNKLFIRKFWLLY